VLGHKKLLRTPLRLQESLALNQSVQFPNTMRRQTPLPCNHLTPFPALVNPKMFRGSATGAHARLQQNVVIYGNLLGKTPPRGLKPTFLVKALIISDIHSN
jgi:hypothetical protein